MTRRRALLLATVAVGSTGLVVVGRGVLRRAVPALVAPLRTPEALDPARPTGDLTPHERATLTALAALILPAAEDGHAAFTLAYIDAQARTVHGALGAYRDAVQLLDARGRGAFVARSTDDQRTTLEQVLLSYPARDRIGRWRARLLRAEADRRFHVLVVRDLAAAFYRSPEGWRRAGHPRGYGEPALQPIAYARPAEGGA